MKKGKYLWVLFISTTLFLIASCPIYALDEYIVSMTKDINDSEVSGLGKDIQLENLINDLITWYDSDTQTIQFKTKWMMIKMN